MKKIFFFILTIVFVLQGRTVNAQTTKSWMQLMHDSNASFYDVQKAFYAWYANQPHQNIASNSNGEDEAGNSDYMFFKRWEYINEPRVYPTGKLPAIGFKEYQKSRDMQNSHKAQSVNTWKLLGPSTIPPTAKKYDSTNTSGWGGGGAGRLNMVWANPLKASTLYAGAASGGLWRSYDAGKTWAPMYDELASLGVNDLQCVPNDTNTMYLATGDADGGSIPSIGLLKSTDNGATWHATGLSYTLAQSGFMGNILIDPINVNTLYVAAGGRIMKSTDSAHTWVSITSWGNVRDIAMNPGNHNLIYATTQYGVYYYSTNGGATWNNQPASLPASGQTVRETIGITPANPSYVYLLAADNTNMGGRNDGFYGFYLSTDSGKNFTAQFTMAANSVDMLGWAMPNYYNPDGGYWANGGQGWYDLSLAVNPKNALQAIIGGVTIWETNNGGTSWTDISNWADSSTAPNYVHADIHSLIYLPDTSAIFAGTDGGIFKKYQGTWSNLSSGLSIGQIYKIGASSHTNNLVISGWQDNGTSENNGPGGTWQNIMGSDGANCLIDWSSDKYQYGSFAGLGWLESSADTGQSFNTISNSINDGSNWVTPFVQDPIDSETIYAGYVSIWKTTDRGGSWSKLTTIPGNAYSAVDIRVASSNHKYIYFTTGRSVYVSNNAGNSWKSISAGLPVSSDYCQMLCISPTNAGRVWAVFSGYDANRVYYSLDTGKVWVNVSSGLPQYPINCIAYQKGTKDGIYVGTDLGGVYYSDSTTKGWVSYSAGLPNVTVNDFQMNYISNQIIAATYGRSIWECNFYSIPTSVNNISQNDIKLNIYPNPNNGSFNLEIRNYPMGMPSHELGINYKVEIYNELGAKVYSNQFLIHNSKFLINIGSQPNGVYLYRVISKSGELVGEGKVMVQK